MRSSRFLRFRLRFSLCLIAVLAVALTLTQFTAKPVHAANVATTFSVPLLGTNTFSADPSLYVYNGEYYMVYSRPGDPSLTAANEVRLRRASSLAGLIDGEDKTIYYNTSLANDFYDGYLTFFNGHFYLYPVCEYGCTVGLESDTADPFGTWTAHPVTGLGQYAGSGSYAFRPMLVGGQLYGFLTSGTNGVFSIYAVKMSDPFTATTAPAQITAPNTGPGSWECAGNANGPQCTDEGGSIILHNNKVYYLFSAGGWFSPDYCVGQLTANQGADLTQVSSWTKSSGCVFTRDDANGVYGPGSMIAFMSPDGTQQWVAYHVKTATTSGLHDSDRRIMAKQVQWNPDGSPNLGVPDALGTYLALPSGDAGVTRYQGEDASFSGGAAAASDHSGYDGSGFAAFLTHQGAAVTFTVTVPNAAKYSLRYRYAAGSGNGSLSVYVDGTKLGQHVFPATNDWNTWGDELDTLDLAAGNNTIMFQVDSGDYGYVNLDYLSVDPALQPYEGELYENGGYDGQVFGGADFAANHLNYQGTGFAADITQVGAGMSQGIKAATTGTYSLTTRYAAGNGNETLSLYINHQKVGQQSFASTGSWDNWALQQTQVTLPAGYNFVAWQMDAGDSGYVNIDSVANH